MRQVVLIAFALCVICQSSIASAGSVFSFNSFVSLRELFRDFDGPDFEFRNIGDVALDPQRGLLYVDARRDGVVMLHESDLTVAGYYTDLLPSVFLTFEMPAFAVEPETGNLYIYDVLCDDCVGTTLPFRARLTTPSPEGDVVSERLFEPFRVENGTAVGFYDMVFQPDGKLQFFVGRGSVSLDVETAEWGPMLSYAQDFSFDAADGIYDPVTGHLFGLSANKLFEFEPDTQELLSVTDLDELIRYPSPVPGARRPQGMVFSADGSKLYITATNSGDSPGTGKLVVLNRTIVPEPTSLALASIAVGVVVIWRRRGRARR